jgi:signal transduction histidine kinase
MDPSVARQATRIRAYLKWVSPASIVFAVILAGLCFLFPDLDIIAITTLVIANAVVQVMAYRSAGMGRITLSAWQQAAGLWTLAIGLALWGAPAYPTVVMLGMLPVIIAVPFVTQGTLVWMSVVGTAITGFAAIFLIGQPLLQIDLPEAVVRAVVGTGQLVTVACCCLSVWYARFTLAEAATDVEVTNRELLASEERLERKVEKRSAALEHSRHALRLARDQALASSRHKSAFLAHMSHELRTPLNAIIGFSDVLSEQLFGELSEKQAEYMLDIHDSALHLLALINDILDLSKIEAGHLALAPKPVALDMLLHDALVAVERRATQRQVALCPQWEPALGEIAADERRLRQVLGNLLENAVKYTDAGGSVSLTARDVGADVEIAVTDTGIGISAEDQELIFEAFRQAGEREGYARAHEGAGVGLALTRKLVELHGGQVSVESETGRGSIFRVRLPRAHASVPVEGS